LFLGLFYIRNNINYKKGLTSRPLEIK
jgi:hypothetical protein